MGAERGERVSKAAKNKKEVRAKMMGVCGHEVKPIKVWRVMKRWCETCNDYVEQIKHQR
jgi:hypothetical protein